MKRIILLTIILIFSCTAFADIQPEIDDAIVVQSSELIIVGHIKNGSVEYKTRKDEQRDVLLQEFNATLVITEVLKGQCNEKEIPIIVPHSLKIVVGGYDIEMDYHREKYEAYPKNLVEIYSTSTSTLNSSPLVKDSSQGNLWFLRKIPSEINDRQKPLKYGISAPEDHRPLELKDYYLAYMTDTPEKAVKEWIKQNPDKVTRAQNYFDHLEIQQILKIEDVNERFEKLLPYYLKYTKWDFKYEAKEGIIACGDVAGDYFLKVFDDPAFKYSRSEIILLWRDLDYTKCIPFLTELLKEHEKFWAEQNLEENWRSDRTNPELTEKRRNVEGEVYYAAAVLRYFHDPQTKEILEIIRNQWKSMDFVDKRVIEECEAALKEIVNQKSVDDVFTSLNTELLALKKDYPELVGIKTGRNEIELNYNCRYWGKRGYEDIEPNSVALYMRIIPTSQFLIESESGGEMQAPFYRWYSLRMVGWTRRHFGNNTSSSLSGKINDIIDKHIEMINELDHKFSQN